MTRYEVTGFQKDGTEVTTCLVADGIAEAVTLAEGNNIVRVAKVKLLPDDDLSLDMNWGEDDLYMSVYNTLLLSGECDESEIEDLVHEILDNPQEYPEFFILSNS